MWNQSLYFHSMLWKWNCIYFLGHIKSLYFRTISWRWDWFHVSIRDRKWNVLDGIPTVSREYPDRWNIGQKNSLYFHSIVWKWNWILVSIRECISRDKNSWFQLEIIIRVSNRAKAHDVRQYKWMRNQSLYFRSIVWLNISYYLK